MVAAARTFKEEMVTSSVDSTAATDFDSFDSRQTRYSIYWAAYESTMYRNIHRWAQQYRNRYGLYRYTRNLYNPTYRLGEFWKMAVWGGILDPQAGESGALPIVVGEQADEDRIRPAIAQLWTDSNWAVNKNIAVLRGAILGDTAIRIVDDQERGEVRMELVHPTTLKDVYRDNRGFVKAYEIEEVWELDGQDVTYTETAERGEGESVIYRTYANGQPYAWDNEAAEWEVPYGFIPLVTIQHNTAGLDWGWAEMHAEWSKLRELDDVASKINDHIRKMVDPVFLFDFAKPKVTPELTQGTGSADRPQPGREELQALYIDRAGAKAQPLVSDLNIEQAFGTLDRLLAELERDLPELQHDIWSTSGDTSGKALRVARERLEAKVVNDRRPNYDPCLVRAQQMALAIGGWRGYVGYDGFNLDSYDKGQLDHSIGDRPVFRIDPMDQVAEKKAFWETVVAVAGSGLVPLETVLRDLGWSEDQLEEFGTQKLAAIKLRQEDRIPEVEQ